MAVKIPFLVLWVMTLCSVVGCYEHWEECTTSIFGLEMGTCSLEEHSASIFVCQITVSLPSRQHFWKCVLSQLNHDIYIHKRIIVFISSDILFYSYRGYWCVSSFSAHEMVWCVWPWGFILFLCHCICIVWQEFKEYKWHNSQLHACSLLTFVLGNIWTLKKLSYPHERPSNLTDWRSRDPSVISLAPHLSDTVFFSKLVI